MSRTIRNEPRAKRVSKNQAPAYRRRVPANVTRAMLRALAAVTPTTNGESRYV